MKNKKSQVKLFETMAILVVFFFLLAIGFFFYAKSQTAGYEAALDESFNLQTMNIIQIVSHLPELQCSSENIITENCFDLLKVQAFQEHATSRDARLYYHNFFSFADITITQIYPSSTGTSSWKIYSNVPTKWRNSYKNHMPILLYDSINRRYNAAVLRVEVYN
jgi:hypothetical protein